MKFIKHITLGVALAIFASACTDFIDIPKEGVVNGTDNPYNDPAVIDGYVSASYASTTAGGQLGHWVLWFTYQMRNDDFFRGDKNDQPDLIFVDQFNNEELAGKWVNSQPWNSLHNAIKSNNEDINAIKELAALYPNDKDVQSKANMGIAEIKVLRDFAYFILVNFYDGVPLVTENTNLDFNYPRTQHNGILQFIIDDMEKCSQYLANVTPREHPYRFGGIVRATALTLQAKAALFLKDFETVEKATDAIISQENGVFDLFSEYDQMFFKSNKMNIESILEFQYSDFGTETGDMVGPGSWFSAQAPVNRTLTYDKNGQPVIDAIHTSDVGDTIYYSLGESKSKPGFQVNGWGLMSQEYGFLKFMKDRGETIRYRGNVLGQGPTGYGDTIAIQVNNPHSINFNYKTYSPSSQATVSLVDGKWIGRTGYGNGNNIRVFRFADVLLMNAEAKVMLGKSGDVPFNRVRARAEMPQISGVTIDDILAERFVELSGEWGSTRMWDLVRHNKAAEVLSRHGYSAGDEYLPTPTSAVDTNPLLSGSPVEYDPNSDNL